MDDEVYELDLNDDAANLEEGVARFHRVLQARVTINM